MTQTPDQHKEFETFSEALIRIPNSEEIQTHYANVSAEAELQLALVTENSAPINEIDIPTPGEVPMFPQEWMEEPEILSAMNLAAVIHATQIRRSGEPTFVQHLFPVAMIAYKVALSTLGEDAAKEAAVEGLLHDSIEDAEKNGLTQQQVENMIMYLFGPEVYRQVCAVTVISPEFVEKRERDGYDTKLWVDRTSEMSQVAQIVKLADLYVNSDGDPKSQRTFKRAQRAFLTIMLGDAAPELARRLLDNLSP